MASGQFLFVKSLHPTPHPQALDTKCERVKKLTDFYISKVSHGCTVVVVAQGLHICSILGSNPCILLRFHVKEIHCLYKIRFVSLYSPVLKIFLSSPSCIIYSNLKLLFRQNYCIIKILKSSPFYIIISFFSLKVSVNFIFLLPTFNYLL